MDDLTPRVLYADDRLLAVDKPVGIAAIPERDLAVPSVQRALEAARGERLWVVHRLDKEVSGLLVFARTADAHRQLSLAFERRQVDKAYLALLVGAVVGDPGQTFTIEHPIHEFGSGRMGIDPRGKASTTHWQALARGVTPGSNDPGHTLVLARPATGRRHQLRVHFYAVGHPIAGDPRYGDHAAQAAYPRLMLHARSLVLPMPDRPALVLHAPPDVAFLAVLAAHGIAAERAQPEP